MWLLARLWLVGHACTSPSGHNDYHVLLKVMLKATCFSCLYAQWKWPQLLSRQGKYSQVARELLSMNVCFMERKIWWVQQDTSSIFTVQKVQLQRHVITKPLLEGTCAPKLVTCHGHRFKITKLARSNRVTQFQILPIAIMSFQTAITDTRFGSSHISMTHTHNPSNKLAIESLPIASQQTIACLAK